MIRARKLCKGLPAELYVTPVAPRLVEAADEVVVSKKLRSLRSAYDLHRTMILMEDPLLVPHQSALRELRAKFRELEGRIKAEAPPSWLLQAARLRLTALMQKQAIVRALFDGDKEPSALELLSALDVEISKARTDLALHKLRIFVAREDDALTAKMLCVLGVDAQQLTAAHLHGPRHHRQMFLQPVDPREKDSLARCVALASCVAQGDAHRCWLAVATRSTTDGWANQGRVDENAFARAMVAADEAWRNVLRFFAGRVVWFPMEADAVLTRAAHEGLVAGQQSSQFGAVVY